jgi:hypothetical protein
MAGLQTAWRLMAGLQTAWRLMAGLQTSCVLRLVADLENVLENLLIFLKVFEACTNKENSPLLFVDLSLG